MKKTLAVRQKKCQLWWQALDRVRLASNGRRNSGYYHSGEFGSQAGSQESAQRWQGQRRWKWWEMPPEEDEKRPIR